MTARNAAPGRDISVRMRLTTGERAATAHLCDGATFHIGSLDRPLIREAATP